MNVFESNDWVHVNSTQIPKSPSLMSIDNLTESEIESICIDLAHDSNVDMDQSQIEIAFYNSFLNNQYNLLDCDELIPDSESDYDDYTEFEDKVERCKYNTSRNGMGKSRKRQKLSNKAEIILATTTGHKQCDRVKRIGQITDLIVELSKQGLRNSGLCKELETLKSTLLPA